MREQEVRELYEAYRQVHQSQEEVEKIDENVQDSVKGALEKGANFMKTNPVGKAVSKIIAPVGSGRGTPTATSGGYRPVKEETDLFDTILEHLVAEGYADTNESALVIMANMSEEWKQSIVEAAADQSDKQIDKGVKTTYKAQNVLDNQHQGRSKGLNKLPRGEREEKAKRMGGRLKSRRDDLFGERNKREDESRAEIKKKYGL